MKHLYEALELLLELWVLQYQRCHRLTAVLAGPAPLGRGRPHFPGQGTVSFQPQLSQQSHFTRPPGGASMQVTIEPAGRVCAMTSPLSWLRSDIGCFRVKEA